ncbi:helix-turn-helix domain-containing protein [Corynebacterium qintianiae]|uniref:helix-turn-helix transcriptional regulator n=1 Tax=Corynebacterium qintianiae TaxID=2709392 RepID=UPI0019808892
MTDGTKRASAGGARFVMSGEKIMTTGEAVPVPPLAVKPREAARILGLSPQTLANWRTLGRGPRYRRVSPGTVVYAVSDLQKWLDGLDDRAHGGGA